MATPTDSARGWQASMDLDVAVRRLPEGARTVFVLHDIEGYRHDEIGTLLGVSVGTSKSQLHRARMALRAHLTAEAAS
ncbi:MAG: RNA polymerase sigma factor [Vicinamibacterales bacterium]